MSGPPPVLVPAGAAPAAGLRPGVDADAVAAAVGACPEVAGLSGGPFGEVATYLPGRRVEGVRVSSDRVEVHVVAWYGVPLRQIADRVRRTVAPVVAGRAVDVSFEDITTG